MKVSKIVRILALSVILVLLIPLLPTPVHAGVETLFAFPYEIRIGEYFELDGTSFRDNDIVFVYLSSQEAAIGDIFDENVTAYEQIFVVPIDSIGSFPRTYTTIIPDALTDGAVVEDVHDGLYYIYAVYAREYEIVAIKNISIINGEISLDIEEDTVGTEVEISGIGLRPNQSITIQYDEYFSEIVSGDTQSASPAVSMI